MASVNNHALQGAAVPADADHEGKGKHNWPFGHRNPIRYPTRAIREYSAVSCALCLVFSGSCGWQLRCWRRCAACLAVPAGCREREGGASWQGTGCRPAGRMIPGRWRRRVDTTVAHIARVYDYWLGGKDHFAVDRIAAERVIAAHPDIVHARHAGTGPSWGGRCGTWWARPGSGSSWTSAPACRPRTTRTRSPRARRRSRRVVYVDNDPVVLSRTPGRCWRAGRRAPRRTSTPTCATRSAILAAAAEVLDFSQSGRRDADGDLAAHQ